MTIFWSFKKVFRSELFFEVLFSPQWSSFFSGENLEIFLLNVIVWLFVRYSIMPVQLNG